MGYLDSHVQKSGRGSILAIQRVVVLLSVALSLGMAGVAFAGPGGCGLGGDVQHVIYIQFDNTHFTRDNPNVPSDLEQMPNLLNCSENFS